MKIAGTPMATAVGALVLGLHAAPGPRCALAAPPLFKLDTPGELTRVSVPLRTSALAWSPDGAYLAAGALGPWPAGQKPGPSEIRIIDVGRAAITATLNIPGSFPGPGLAFSPDGKWLAVGTPARAGEELSELAVFDVPAFTRKFTAKPGRAKAGFIDLAWSADSKALCAIEGSDRGEEMGQIRRWAMPAFTEQPAIRAPQSERYSVLAVSPDGSTLAVAEYGGSLRLFDSASGAERSSFKIGSVAYGWRLGFTPDGKTVALFDQGRPSWFDPTTGKAAKPKPARIAVAPAALSDNVNSRNAISLDCRKQIWGGERHPTIMFEKASKTDHGAYIDITDVATGKTWKWRVGEAKDTGDTPAVALSPDGTKLAGAARQPAGQAVIIWAMPKK